MALNKALGSLSTVAWVLANPVDTGRIVWTLIVLDTAWRHWVGDGYARPVRVWYPTLPAGTDHCPEGNCVHHRAHSSVITGAERIARVSAFVV